MSNRKQQQRRRPMADSRPVNDSLSNLVSGLGTSRDKNSSNQYALNILTHDQLQKAYRGDWIARKIIDIPAEDATREWRAWQGSKEQISAIEAEEARLGVQQKAAEGLVKSRLWGGSILLIGIRNADWSQPLNLEAVGKGDLEFVHCLDRYEIGISDIESDPLSPYYGQPKGYTVSSPSLAGQVIHPSRVVRLIGKKLPSRQLESDGFGDSVLQAVDDAIKQAGLSSAAVATLINEASFDVIKIPDFMQNVATAEYRNRIMQRFQLAQVGKSLLRTTLLDKEEDWQRITTNFSTLPDVIRTFLNVAAGAGDIPATRLLGQSPTGLNATGESDIRNYYDMVGSEQRNRLGPAMYLLDEVLIRSALGERPPEVHYNWRPLWQMTQAEQAAVMLNRAQAITALWQTNLIPEEALAIAVQNMLIEAGDLPGLEEALAEADPLSQELDETSDADPPQV